MINKIWFLVGMTILLGMITFCLMLMSVPKAPADEIDKDALIFQSIKQLQKEVETSRQREDLLLQEVNLLDYQISVLTESIIKDE